MVIFHAFPESLRGGFVGVDIFFVISGFLISSILFRNLLEGDTQGHVRIVDFYIRRVKRIFPALITVLISCLIFGWYVLLPEEFESLGKHIAGGATYVSNFMLYFEDGDYFNKSTALKPLMHLWSLGVEEQFYIVFPILLWLVYRSNLNFLLFLIVFSVISFCLNRNGINHGSQSAAFYMPWYRFWELSSGAILAYTTNYCRPQLQALKDRFAKSRAKTLMLRCLLRRTDGESRGIPAGDVISFLGLALIVCGYVSIRNGANFPGTKALLPVCGALCVIAAGKESFINRRILSNRVMVFLGLISYPLYLWHWPLLSFAHIIEGEDLSVQIRIGAVILALTLAALTFLVIEPPLRYGKHLGIKAVGLFAMLLAVGAIGFHIYANHGYKERFAGEYPANIDFLENQMELKNQACRSFYPRWPKKQLHCVLSEHGTKPNTAVFGDSHASALIIGLENEFSARGIQYNMFPISAQIPYYGFLAWSEDLTHGPSRTIGSSIQDQAFLMELQDPEVKNFMFIHNAECSHNHSLIDMLYAENNQLSTEEKYRIGFRRTMDMITSVGKKALFIFDNPHLSFNPSPCISRPIALSEHKCSIPRQEYDQEPSHLLYEKVIREEIVNYPNAAIVELAPLFCDNKECHAVKDGKLMYADKDHLNKHGSLMVAPTIVDALMKLDAKK